MTDDCFVASEGMAQLSTSAECSPSIIQALASLTGTESDPILPSVHHIDSVDDLANKSEERIDFKGVAQDSSTLEWQESTTGKRNSHLTESELLASGSKSQQVEYKSDDESHRSSNGRAPVKYDSPGRGRTTTDTSSSESVVESIFDRQSTLRQSQRPARSLSESARRSAPIPLCIHSRFIPAMQSFTNVDKTLKPRATSHDFTLQYTSGTQHVVSADCQSCASGLLQTGERVTSVSRALYPGRLGSPRNNSSSAYSSTEGSTSVESRAFNGASIRGSFPARILQTSYPFTNDSVNRASLDEISGAADRVSTAPTPRRESVLILSLQRSNANRRLRITSLTIPTPNALRTTGSANSSGKEQHFRAIDFDDAEFFRQLRKSYKKLSGAPRLWSARSLARISVSGSATRAIDAEYGWSRRPSQNPRVSASQIGRDDIFSEDKILQYYRKPALGRSQYAFVEWAHRLAAATAPADIISSPEGLEFVESWSIARICFALSFVLVLSAATVLLWIFLGPGGLESHPPQASFRDASNRVAGGVLMGIWVLLVGLGGVAGWLGITWLVM